MIIIDVEKAWRLMDGDGDLYRELFAIIERSLPEKYSNIEKALATDSAEDLELYAHQLKGALRNVAAEKACDLLYRLERCGATQDLPGARELYPQVKPLVEEMLAWFRTNDWEAEFQSFTRARSVS